MWLNCIYGGKGVGMINLLLFLIIGIFLAGQMVGRTPEYLGKKIGGREMKLAMIALLVHPFLILGRPDCLRRRIGASRRRTTPARMVFRKSSTNSRRRRPTTARLSMGWECRYGLNNNPSPSPEAVPWDIAGGLVIMFGRYLPIVAPIAMAAFLGMKKSTPFGLGTLRDDTFTFGCLLFGTIVIVGALLFLPVAALGPLAEHLGPIPFGG